MAQKIKLAWQPPLRVQAQTRSLGLRGGWHGLRDVYYLGRRGLGLHILRAGEDEAAAWHEEADEYRDGAAVLFVRSGCARL